MKMRKNALSVLLASSALLMQLSGCGGGGGSSSNTTSSSTTLTGTAMAGPFLSGQACAYRISNAAKGSLLGTCTNLANSAFSINIGNYTGDVLIEIAAGATYDDEANPGDTGTGTTLTGAMRSLVNVATAGSTLNIAVTPLTELAVRQAGATLSAASVQTAINQLLPFLPTVNGLDLRTTVPASSSDLGLAYREILRALSQMQWLAGSNAPYSGGLDAYLTTLLGQINSSSNTVAADLLSQLNNGLNSSCANNAGALSCKVSTGGTGTGGNGTNGPAVNAGHLATLCPGAQSNMGGTTQYTGCSGSNINGTNIAVLNAVNSWMAAHGSNMNVYNSNYSGVNVGAKCSFAIEPALGLWLETVNNAAVPLTPGSFDGTPSSAIEVDSAGEIQRMVIGDFMASTGGREINFLANHKIDVVYQAVSGSTTTRLFCGN